MRAFCYCLAFFGMTSVCTLKYQKLSLLPSYRKLDGTCGFTTFTRFFLLWRCYLWRHLPTKQCSVFSTNLWLWSQMELNPSLTLSRSEQFFALRRERSFSKASSIFRMRGTDDCRCFRRGSKSTKNTPLKSIIGHFQSFWTNFFLPFFWGGVRSTLAKQNWT